MLISAFDFFIHTREAESHDRGKTLLSQAT